MSFLSIWNLCFEINPLFKTFPSLSSASVFIFSKAATTYRRNRTALTGIVTDRWFHYCYSHQDLLGSLGELFTGKGEGDNPPKLGTKKRLSFKFYTICKIRSEGEFKQKDWKTNVSYMTKRGDPIHCFYGILYWLVWNMSLKPWNLLY